MYRARDRVDNEEWIERIHEAATELELDAEVRSNATDLFLTHVPDEDRSKPATAAASLYAAALIAGEERSQGSVADAFGVTRLSVQSNWKSVLSGAGFHTPDW